MKIVTIWVLVVQISSENYFPSENLFKAERWDIIWNKKILLIVVPHFRHSMNNIDVKDLCLSKHFRIAPHLQKTTGFEPLYLRHPRTFFLMRFALTNRERVGKCLWSSDINPYQWTQNEATSSTLIQKSSVQLLGDNPGKWKHADNCDARLSGKFSENWRTSPDWANFREFFMRV